MNKNFQSKVDEVRRFEDSVLGVLRKQYSLNAVEGGGVRKRMPTWRFGECLK